MKLIDYLGAKSSELFSLPLFNAYTFEKTVEEDLPTLEIHYLSEENGMSFTCDGDENIQSIFIEAESLHLLDNELPVHGGRQEVIARLGMPSLSGEAHRHEILGMYGAWDRYDFEGYSIHFSYELLGNGIYRVTLMTSAVVPQGLHPPMQ